MTLAMRPLLEQAGLGAPVHEPALQTLRDGNEDPAGFSVLSPDTVIDVQV